jgi:hypothetical protein
MKIKYPGESFPCRIPIFNLKNSPSGKNNNKLNINI